MARSGSAPQESRLDIGSGEAEQVGWQERGNRGRMSQEQVQGSNREGYPKDGFGGVQAQDSARYQWKRSQVEGTKHNSAHEGPTSAERSNVVGHDMSRDRVVPESPAVAHAFYTAVTPETGLAQKTADMEGVPSPVSAAALRHPLALMENTPLARLRRVVIVILVLSRSVCCSLTYWHQSRPSLSNSFLNCK